MAYSVGLLANPGSGNRKTG